MAEGKADETPDLDGKVRRLRRLVRVRLGNKKLRQISLCNA